MIETAAPSRDLTRVSGRRYVAHFVDGVLFTIMFLLAIVVVGLLPSGTLGDVLLWATLVLGFTVGQVAYYVLTQRRDGQTPGKRLVGIRVVDERGAVPSTDALVKRTIPLLVEYFYIIAWIGMMTSDHRQRLGDRWAHTYVIDA
jgi:uncharacterized RDD family membrane protein YckC